MSAVGYQYHYAIIVYHWPVSWTTTGARKTKEYSTNVSQCLLFVLGDISVPHCPALWNGGLQQLESVFEKTTIYLL